MMKNAALKTWIGPLIGGLLFSAAIWILHQELSAHHLKDILLHIRALPKERLVAALLLTAAGYGVMTTYDVLALRYLKQPLAYGRVALAAFVGAAFSNNIGLSMIAGASVRYRFYASWGLSALEITQVVLFCTLTLWLGFFTIGGLAFLLDPVSLSLPLHLPATSTRTVGVLMMLAVIGYLTITRVRSRPFRFRGLQIDLPSWKTGLLQMMVGAADWLLAGSALIILLPATQAASLPTLLVIYLSAQLIGLISQVPGGLGVFETVFLLLAGGLMPAEAVMGALFAYRVIYYLVPLLISSALLGINEFLSHRDSLRKILSGYLQWSEPVVPPVLAFTTFVAGAILLFSGATPALDHRLAWLQEIIPLPLLEISHFLGSLAGIGLILLARGLQRRLDGAYWVTLAVLATGIVLSLVKGLDYEEALLLILPFGALLPSRRFFYRRTSLLNQSFTPAWIMMIAVVMISTVWLTLFSYKHVEYSGNLWWQFAFDATAPRSLRATAGAAAILFAFAVAHLLRPSVYRSGAATSAEMAAVEKIVAESSQASANLALLGDKSFLFSSRNDAFIMYAVERRSWVSMGDPVGPEDQWPELIWRFREQSDRFGGWTAFYQITPDHLPYYLDLGLSLTKLGETARVPLAAFSLDGSRRKGLRYTQRKLHKEGYCLRVLGADQVRERLDRLQEISDAWLTEKHTHEKGFSLGSFNPEYLCRFDMATVERADETIAFATLWKTELGSELSVDLMRYDPASAPNGIMDFLFVEVMNWGRDRNYQWFDLGMAPLSGIDDRSLAPLWNRMAGFVSRHGGHFYNFQGLRHYKEKFDPVWEPRYLASPSGLILPLILSDLARLISGGMKGALLK
ncbi:MAG: bifunctional lysylphosphatidylglycerol flippase/synthetase MprF [Desulfofustis sp.]|nr:bifunctional lysylphosphatidylglycerol flippase/synthetase MprF [Desulfofustis sp.]